MPGKKLNGKVEKAVKCFSRRAVLRSLPQNDVFRKNVFSYQSQEIKKLVAASGERAERIREIVAAVDVHVDSGFEAARRAANALGRMTEETGKTAALVRAAARESDARMAEGSVATRAFSEIDESSERVRGETAKQNGFSVEVREAMTTLAEISSAVRVAVEDILNHDRDLIEQSAGLRCLAASSREIAVSLGRMTGMK